MSGIIESKNAWNEAGLARSGLAGLREANFVITEELYADLSIDTARDERSCVNCDDKIKPGDKTVYKGRKWVHLGCSYCQWCGDPFAEEGHRGTWGDIYRDPIGTVAHVGCLICRGCGKQMDHNVEKLTTLRGESGQAHAACVLCWVCGSSLRDDDEVWEYVDGKRRAHLGCLLCSRCDEPLSNTAVEADDGYVHADCYQLGSVTPDEHAAVNDNGGNQS